MPCLSAQTREPHLFDRKRVRCKMDRLSIGPRGGHQESCGTRGYTRVFTGTVRSVVDARDTDKRVELIPDEVFVGDKSELTATFNQACLLEKGPEIKPGDRWLFYLRPKPYWDPGTRDMTTAALEVPINSPSKPVTEAEDDIAILHRLAGLTDKGILTGRVVRVGPTYDDLRLTAIPNHRIVAKSWSSGIEFTAFSNLDGRFELELPAGSYDVTVASEGMRDANSWTPKEIEPIAGLHALIGTANIGPGGCAGVDFSLLADGKLAGRVTTRDGKPGRFLNVAIIPVSPVHPQFTVETDEDGHFEVGGRQAGQYIIGVGLLAPFDSAEWRSRVYYPGVPTREQARIIELGDGEWRTDIEFSLPPRSTRAQGNGPK